MSTKSPLESELYAGIASLKSPVERFDFGHGIELRKTFCHVFSPFLAAFAPAENGQPHPAPWRGVSGGRSFDIHFELHVPKEFGLDPFFDRLNTVWWFVSLLRLRANPYAIVPVIADHPFAEMASISGDPTFWTIEADRKFLKTAEPHHEVTLADFEWIKNRWQSAGSLMGTSTDFNTAFQAIDQAISDRTSSVALLTLWGALERLFSPSHQELTFRISANIATYLEPPGEARLALFKRVKQLYGARSKAAHGSADRDHEAFTATYQLLRQVLLRIIDSNQVPDRDALETLMFAH